MLTTSFRRRLNVRSSLTIALFVYLAIVRTRHISGTFWLLGDQIRDWTVALGSWRDLPLTGTPSTVGGTSLGPVYYWTLWAIRHLVGPWTANLPHAGGIGLSLIQSAADVALFRAVWRRFDSMWLALGFTLLVATAPYDLALTATVWNPPLAVALVKMTMALVLLRAGHPSIWWGVAITVAAWLAVQAHSPAIFVAAPVVASLVIDDLLAHRWKAALQQARASVEVIALLQLPLLLHMLRHPGDTAGPTTVVGSVIYTVTHPGSLRLEDSFDAFIASSNFILLGQSNGAWLGSLLAACSAVVVFRMRRDAMVLGSTVLPVLCAIGGFALWQLPFDHYWFLTLMPSVALTLGLTLTAWRRAAGPVAIALTMIVVVLQPARLTQAMTLHRLPEYAPLVRGSREIWRHAPEIRAITTDFSLPQSTDREFLYKVLGGRVTRDAQLAATIGPSGEVAYTAVPR